MPRSRKDRAAAAAAKPAVAPPKRAKTSPNGHGGARSGAGRKRDKLPDDVIERLGDPPEDPRKLRVWNARLLAEVQVLNMKGEISNDLAASLRAGAGAIDRALPVERPGASEDDDDDEEEETSGAELESVSDAPLVRLES